MQRNEIMPDDITLGSVISSCANLSSLEEGVQFHAQALMSGLISFISVSNALITLYGKCGSVEECDKLFYEMKFRDEVSWTAMVSGYAQFGKAEKTIDLFEEMLRQGLKPDPVTFIGVLSACSRAGLVERGRAGRLQEAKDFIHNMPFQPDAIGWATLLSSCRVHSNLEIGKWAAESLLEVEPNNPAGYILLTSIYASQGKWNNVAELRRGMREKGLRKDPGCSWIKFKNKLYIFSADDFSSPFYDQIYAELEKLNEKMIQMGYVPDPSSVLHDVEESEKIKMLGHHSEKLITQREILVRDCPVPFV
ncbi:Putative pentatricopeptide repeat-containing protein At1g68930 [Linum perenne]